MTHNGELAQELVKLNGVYDTGGHSTLDWDERVLAFNVVILGTFGTGYKVLPDFFCLAS
jgi:hypothetical protein